MYLSLYCKGSKRVTQGFTVRGSWRPNRTAIYWPPLLWPSALCLSRSPGLLNRRPGGSAFCWVLAFSTTSCQQPLWSPTHQGPLHRAFSTTSYQQLLCTPTQSGTLRTPSAWRCFPYHISFYSNSISNFFSWLSYILVQRPLNRPLNLWNGMFDRHQAEITVMQFTGHSLPVSMGVPWDFFYLVPFHQPNPAISFDYWPLGCVTSFRCITLEWHICPGRRSKYNNWPE